MSDNIELRRKQNDYICRNLPDDILPISPVKMFEFEDDDSRREEILQVCFDLIDMCDEAWFYMYGNYRSVAGYLSEGQAKEYDYICNNLIRKSDFPRIPEFVKFIKPPKKCMQMEEHNQKYEKNVETLKKMTTNYKLQRELMEPVNEGWI